MLVSHVAVRTSHQVRSLAHHPAYINATLARSRHFTLHAPVLVLKINTSLLSVLGISSQAEDLLLGAQGAHIHQRRPELSAQIIRAIPAALLHITHVGFTPGKPKLRHIVGKSSIGKRLLVALKFVPANKASTGKDEAWVTTAHYVDDQELRRRLRRKLLRPSDAA